jgi:nitrate/TMAO reductase-like tetraheme cytochrome c subunit
MSFLLKRFSQMTRGGIIGFLAVALVAGVALFAWGARWVNTSPQQCATCHPGITAMWQRSQGHPAAKVTCHECHAEHDQSPVRPNLATYFRDDLIPEKYLSTDLRLQNRCESCHKDIRKADKEKKQLIRINHKVHLAPIIDPQGRKTQLGCMDCHRAIAHDKAQVETNRPRMAGCFAGSCHPKDRNKDNCRRCHYQQLLEPGQEAQQVL